MTIQTVKHWLLAFRPKTLAAGFAPVLMGTAMAFGDGVDHIPTAVLCFFAAMSVQIGTNLSNDYYDFKSGADSYDRIGPTRVTQAGLIKPQQVKIGFLIAFLICAICSTMLAARAGWPIIILGVVSILSGYFYTAGPKPLGYVGLGDIYVLVFFGPVALAATYYVQSFEMNAAVLISGFAPGLLSVAILAVNNLRDIESDRRANKKTLAVRFGSTFAKIEYIASVITACLIPVLIFFITADYKLIMLSTFLLIPAVPLFIIVSTKKDGDSLNKVLGFTGMLLLIFSIIYSIGWIK